MKITAPGHEYLNCENETALMEASFMISISENTDESNPIQRNGHSLHGFFLISCHFSISTLFILDIYTVSYFSKSKIVST